MIFQDILNNYKMKISIITNGDKFTGTINTTVASYLYSQLNEKLNFDLEISEMKYISFPIQI